MFGFRYITFVGILMLLQHLREADSNALHNNENRNFDYRDGPAIQLTDETTSHQNDGEVDGETAGRAKRTTLAATIDGKFTVHLIVSVKPAEQVVVPPRVKSNKVGRLRTRGGPAVQSPATNSKSCQNEYCDFAMELELLKQVSKPAVDSSGEIKKEEDEEINNQNETRSQGRVRIPITPAGATYAAAKRDSKLRSNRTRATTSRYPMSTPSSIKPVLSRNQIETTTRSSVSKRVSNKPRAGVARYQSTRIATNATTRSGRIRAPNNATGRGSNPLLIDSREELVLFSEKRNENGPNKSRARQLGEGKSPSALLSTRYQTTRIHRKKVADSDVRVGTNESIPTEMSQVQNISRSDKPECNVTSQFDVPIFRDSIEHKNVSSDKINVTTTPAAEEVAAPTTVGSTIFMMPVPLNRRKMSNATQLDGFKTESVTKQNNGKQSEGLPAIDIPLEAMTTTEETILNPTEETVLNQTDNSVQAETTDDPISINSEDPDSLPWEQIGDFEFQIHPKSKQVVSIRLMQTTTTTETATASDDPVTKWDEQQGNHSSLNQPQEQQQDHLDVELLLGTAATTLEVPAATVIPTQTVIIITPTVKLPIPLNRRKPIDGTQSERVETPLLEPSREIVIIPARPMESVEQEQTANFSDNQTSTTQKPELFTLSSEATTEQQIVNGFTETATAISVQQTTEINSSSEIQTSQDNYRNTSIADPTELGLSINGTEEKVGESRVVEKMNLESAREPITSTAAGIPIPTTTTPNPMPVEFPWEQRHDYEVQVNPTTKEIVNIRLLTTTTTTTSKPLVSKDHFDRTLSESLLTDEEQDELTMEVLSRILERNGKFRTLVTKPRLTNKNSEKVDDGVKVAGTTARVAAVSSDQTNQNAAAAAAAAAAPPIRTAVSSHHNRDRTASGGRKPIFSHSTEDGVFYFRYANNGEDPSKADNNRNHPEMNIDSIITDDEIIRETDWNTRQRNHNGPVRKDSPYFYYAQDGINSSALVKASCYVLFLVACVLLVL